MIQPQSTPFMPWRGLLCNNRTLPMCECARPWRRIGGVKIKLYAFLLLSSEPVERTVCTHWTVGWPSTRISLDIAGWWKEKHTPAWNWTCVTYAIPVYFTDDLFGWAETCEKYRSFFCTLFVRVVFMWCQLRPHSVCCVEVKAASVTCSHRVTIEGTGLRTSTVSISVQRRICQLDRRTHWLCIFSSVFGTLPGKTDRDFMDNI